jgi:hypothetical protein
MRLKIAIVAVLVLGGAALTSTAASAMPNGMSPNVQESVGQTSNIQQARWVRGPRGRMVWRRGPRRFVAVGPRRRFVAVGPRRVWRPGWSGAGLAWGTGPVWGAPQPAWGGSFAWGGGPAWGPRPGWGWNTGWGGGGWNNSWW